MALTLLLFDAAGTPINRQEWDDLLAAVAAEAPTDVFLLAHGWNVDDLQRMGSPPFTRTVGLRACKPDAVHQAFAG